MNKPARTHVAPTTGSEKIKDMGFSFLRDVPMSDLRMMVGGIDTLLIKFVVAHFEKLISAAEKEALFNADLKYCVGIGRFKLAYQSGEAAGTRRFPNILRAIQDEYKRRIDRESAVEQTGE